MTSDELAEDYRDSVDTRLDFARAAVDGGIAFTWRVEGDGG